MARILKPGGICLVVTSEPPKSGLLRMIVENHMTPMAHVDVRDYVPLLSRPGLPKIETGPTSFEAAIVCKRQSTERMMGTYSHSS